MKEYSSLNIIPQEVLSKLKTDKDEEIKTFMKDIFHNASRKDWKNIHHMTRKANYWCISKEKIKGRELGFHRTYQHTWNQLFHQGYSYTIQEKNSNFLNVSVDNSEIVYAIDACIKNMEAYFLGSAYQLAYCQNHNKKEFEEEDKTEFRKCIERMYELGKEQGIYKYNPFKDESYNFEKQENKNYEYLNNDVFDFEKGYGLIQEKLLIHFKKCLEKVMNQENRAKSENLMKINYDLYLQLEKLKYDFEKRYEGIKFDDLFNYSSKNREDNM